MGWRTPVVVVLVVGLTAACGPGADGTRSVPTRAVATYADPRTYRVGKPQLDQLTARLDPQSPQRGILADGRVTSAELDGAWAAYTQCIEAAGFTVTSQAWDPVTNTQRILAYAPRGGAATATTTPTATPTATPTTTPEGTTTQSVPDVDACEEEYWFPVSAIYAADTPPHMTNELTRAMVSCMAGRGYDVRGSRDFGAVVGAIGGRASGPRVDAGRACLAGALPRLYPDLPYYPRP